MIEKLRDFGPRLCQASLPDVWPSLEPRILGVLAEFYEEPVPLGLYPHFNELALRAGMLMMVPELAAFRGRVTELFQSGYGAVVIDDLHLQGKPPALRNKLLYALCIALGFLTPSTQRQTTLLWDVKQRPVLANRPATYSEHSAEADLHTDSQGYPVPEELFALYVIHAARCGGGASTFLCLDPLRETLAATPEGRDALAVLASHQFPFSLQPGESATRAGAVTTAPILADAPGIRFRRDVVEQGFIARPDLATQEARAAVAALLAALARAPVTTYALGDGSIALCNNHTMLHGRTAFTDPERHLLRTRMSARPVALNVATFIQQNAAFAKALMG
jgi:alpha-ketoglutarate-dependent taurine dioxygenase